MTVPYQKILVPLDGSELAKQALPHAELLAQKTGATLILLQLVPRMDELVALTHGMEFGIKAIDQRQQALVDEASVGLQHIVDDLKVQHIEAKALVDIGDPATRITTYAEANGVDLIVMSTHGRAGVQRWVMGSVANKVLAVAPCPVLLVRPT
ncbi:MAG: universal stress protein [Caldilineaceae bacterium]